MRVIAIRENQLVLEERPAPTPEKGEVRVRVHATAVNRADLLQVRGGYAAPPDAVQDVPGLEYAGVIDAVGPGAHRRRVGDRVFGLVGGGSYAEALVVHEELTCALPEGLDFTAAAALPEAYLTAYDAMVTQAGLAAGETVLIHAVGSGVGTAAVQIARAVGARSIGTARTEEKLDDARALGLDVGLLVQNAQFSSAVLEHTGGRGVDVVLDLVGGDYFGESAAGAAPRGRLVLVGLLAGPRCDLDLVTVLRKRLTLRGTVLRSRPLEERIAGARVLERHLSPLFATSRLTPVVHAVLPLERAAEAHALVAKNVGFGKIVLDCGASPG
ncbi:MAG: NAD(P)H-quinone oxidoreductase [Myxococcales bacterium]|nr:NAD(P)H-quinone oxidoreductase [Myxococcales bacterium]